MRNTDKGNSRNMPTSLRDVFADELTKRVSRSTALPPGCGTLQTESATVISFDGVNGEILRHLLAKNSILVETGSLCGPGPNRLTKRLQDLEVPFSQIRGSIEFNLTAIWGPAEMELQIETISKCVEQARAIAGNYAAF